MTIPLVILAGCSVLIGFIGTPAWPWLHTYLTGEAPQSPPAAQFLLLAFLSSLIVGAGIGAAWYLYRTIRPEDPLAKGAPGFFNACRNRFWFDEAYDATVIALTRSTAQAINRVESAFFASIRSMVGLVTLAFGWLSRLFDSFVIDLGFDRICGRFSKTAFAGSRFQNGRIQTYLQTIALTLIVLVLALAWGCKGV